MTRLLMALTTALALLGGGASAQAVNPSGYTTATAGGDLCGILPSPRVCPNVLPLGDLIPIPQYTILGNGLGLTTNAQAVPAQDAGVVFCTVLVNGVTPTIELCVDPSQVPVSLGTPTVLGNGLGTSPVIVPGVGSISGTITVGTSPSSGQFRIQVPSPAPNGITCVVQDTTSNATFTLGQVSFTTNSTSSTGMFQAYSRTTGLAAALNAADVLTYQCAKI